MINSSQHIKMEDIDDIESAVNYCIQCIENNNHINSGSWSDWVDAAHIISTYLDIDLYDPEYDSDNLELLESLASSGLLLKALQSVLDAKKKGLNRDR